MHRIIAGLLLAALGVASAQSRTFTGTVTDTMCKTNHRMMGGKLPDGQCTIDCVKTSKNVKYALHDGTNLYVLSDQETPQKFAAQKVRVKGVLYEKTKIIKVESIEAAK
jgi:hypothetical protein